MSSFLSSFFGIGGSRPTTQQVVTSSKLPEEIAPFAKEVLEEAQTLYKQQMKDKYTPYKGETIAGFTPEQIQAQEGIKGLLGKSQPLMDEALLLTRGLGDRFTADTAKEYMSPYQQAVTDIEKREAQKTFERDIMPRFEKQAVEAGGMSGMGSRAAIQASQLGQAQMQQMGDIQTKGLQRAYADAQQQFAQQKERERMQAKDLFAAGPEMFRQGIAEQGALQTIGEQKQDLAQTAMDEAYYKFLEEQQYPQQKLAEYSGFVYGNPLMKQLQKTETTSKAGPGLGQQLLGLAGAGANIYGMGGGFGGDWSGKTFSKNMGWTRAAGGQVGGLSSLPVVYSQAGTIDAVPIPGFVYEEENENVMGLAQQLLKEGGVKDLTPSAEQLQAAQDVYEASLGERQSGYLAAQKQASEDYMNRIRAAREEAYAREKELAPEKGGFLTAFSKGAMAMKDGRPQSPIEALISGMTSGSEKLTETEKERKAALLKIAQRKGSEEIADLGTEETRRVALDDKTYQKNINALNRNKKLKDKIMGLPAQKQKEILTTATSVAELKSAVAKANLDIAKADAEGKGVTIKPGVYAEIRKTFDQMAQTGLFSGEMQRDGSLRITRVKIGRDLVPLTQAMTAKVNKILATATAMGDIPAAAEFIQREFEALSKPKAASQGPKVYSLPKNFKPGDTKNLVIGRIYKNSQGHARRWNGKSWQKLTK